MMGPPASSEHRRATFSVSSSIESSLRRSFFAIRQGGRPSPSSDPCRRRDRSNEAEVDDMVLRVLRRYSRTRQSSPRDVALSPMNSLEQGYLCMEAMQVERSHENQPTESSPKTRKRVSFSDRSTLVRYCRDEATSPDEPSELHYSPADFLRFEKDAVRSSRRVRSIIEEGQAQEMQETRHRKPLARYTEAWRRLPILLEEHGVALEEALGLEHLVVGKDISGVSLALQSGYKSMLLEEQRRQECLRGSCPLALLAATARPFTKVSTSIASYKAEQVATSCR